MKCPRSIGSIGAGKFMWSEQRLAAHKVPSVKARSPAARKFSRDASPLLALQQVADFREQRLLLGHRRRLRRLRLHDLIHQLDHEKQTQAMMMKLMMTVRKLPHASTAPCFLASASEVAVTFEDSGRK